MNDTPQRRPFGARAASIVVLALGALATPAVEARDLPLWELGLGVGGLWFPDYRGSDETRGWVLPVPYVVYRGEFFKADRNGIRGMLFNTDRLDLNISVNASQPVSSDSNDARSGMPDLKPSIEIGPSLDITLWRANDRRTRLDLRLPVRAAVSIESNPRSLGWIASPRINLDIADIAGQSGWNLGLLAGPIYATRRQHDYFYSVSPAFASANRPAYSAPGGYSGTQFLAALSKRFPGYWIGGFARYDTLKSAAFEDSPLVRRNNAVFAGVAIAWILGESSTRVNADE
ncbi:MAG: MipA/OmpV family protein [Candidatus Methylophosphatis roskildensis]